MLGRKLFSSGLVLGLVVSVCFPAHAELLKNFKADGSIEVRSFAIDNEVDRKAATDDYRSETNTRTMIGGSFDLLDDVHARVLLRKNNRNYGNGNGGGGGGASEDLNTVQTNVFVDNAYTKIDKVFGHVDLTMGRQFYGPSDDLVIYFGPQNDDVLNVTALDTFRADADIMGWAKFQGIAGKISDTGATGLGANTDTDVWGVDLNTDKLLPKSNLGAYYYTKQVKKGANVVNGNNTLNVYGARLMGDVPVIDGLGYKAEGIMNGGRNNGIATKPGYGGNAFFLAAHYGRNMSNMPFRAGVEWGKGSSTFTPIAAGKRFGIIWGEHTTVVGNPSSLDGGTSNTGLSNLNVVDAGIGVNPITKLRIDVNWYRFRKSDKLAGTGSGLSSLGTEYDFIVSWKHSDNVSLEANWATFQVGDALKPAGGNSPITRLGADVKLKF